MGEAKRSNRLLLIDANSHVVFSADYTGSKSSGDAIKKLQEASASKVGVQRGGKWVHLPTRELVPGDLVAVTIGMTIPADGVVASKGEPLKLDYSSLTGEPLLDRTLRPNFLARALCASERRELHPTDGPPALAAASAAS